MIGRTYREILLEDAGYNENDLSGLTEEDCKAEYVEITIGGAA